MKILRAYALRELVTPFLMSLALFTFVFLMGNMVKLADLLVNKGVSVWTVLKIIAMLLPSLLAFTIPTSVLTAILLVFGGFAQNNEVTAIRANGINLLSIMSPILCVAFLVSLLMVILSDQVFPRLTFEYRRTIKDLFLKRPTAYLEPGKFVKSFQDYIIMAQKIDGNRLENITIYQPVQDKPTRTIIAERGEVIASEDERSLAIRLYNGTSDEPNPDKPDEFYKLDFKVFELPPMQLSNVSDYKSMNKKMKDMTIDELLAKLKRDPEVRGKKNVVDLMVAEIHKKISFSFASFLFALVGLPLALITRRGEAVVSFGLAIGVIAIYYVLYVLAKSIVQEGFVAPWLALWAPNLLVLAVGVLLMRKVLST